MIEPKHGHFLLAAALLLMVSACGCQNVSTPPSIPKQPPQAKQAADAATNGPKTTGGQKDARHDMPIVIEFPDLPEVPEKIKPAAAPTNDAPGAE